LIFVFSAANSDLYIASRTLHGLALKGHAPKVLAKTTKVSTLHKSVSKTGHNANTMLSAASRSTHLVFPPPSAASPT
jgi:amino acid permease